jgi:cobyrinic acid a,c-diamide synthase
LEVTSRFLIAAPSSNSGKTTLTLGLLRALVRRGLNVQAFKCGPDYIDPMHHATATGKPSIALDTFMSSENHVSEIYQRYSNAAEVAVIEGVMGLFDGYERMRGSSAALAELLDVPIILVINAQSMAYSVAPLLYGLKNFYPGIRIAGVIFNFVNTESHYRFLKEACEDVGLESLGYLPKDESFLIPSRHLGLTIDNTIDYEAIIDSIAKKIPQTIDLERLLASCRYDKPTPTFFEQTPSESFSDRRIAVAKDAAFSFIYEQNIEILKQYGTVTYFSPLQDSQLPETDFLYLPGGYPELFGKALSSNKSMLQSITDYCKNGGKTYAECGGMMYLGKSIVNQEGNNFGMTGVFDWVTSIENKKLTLGYRQVDWSGIPIRGHEFHYSQFLKNNCIPENFAVTNAKDVDVSTAVYRYKNTFASYIHLYWGNRPEFILELLQLPASQSWEK